MRRDESPQRGNEMDSPSFVFKTEKNKDDERYSHTGMNVKTHTNHDVVRATARSLWSEARLRSYIDHPSIKQLRACSDIFLGALRERPHQLQLPSFTALSSQAIFMFLWIRLLFIHKTHTLRNLFFNFNVTRIADFYEPQFVRISLIISLSDSALETEKTFRHKC